MVAIARIRESARADFCRENLRRIGQGLQAYHQTYGMLPPAAIRSRPTDTLELKWRTSWNEPYTMAYDHANWVTLPHTQWYNTTAVSFVFN